MLGEQETKRLNILRYGLIVVTAVAFALTAVLVYIGSGKLWTAILQGIALAAVMAFLCAVIYYLYRSYLEKASPKG